VLEVLGNYISKTPRPKRYMKKLESIVGFPIIDTSRGQAGTWVHPRLAIKILELV
jgi:hypothetical protein